LGNDDKEKISVIKKWTDNSLLEEIINYSTEYDLIEKDQLIQILRKNFLKTLKQWNILTEEQKDKDGYPRGLRNILDNVSGKNKKLKFKRNKQ
jgi:hypothetical protein